jgi:hypothetical protein
VLCGARNYLLQAPTKSAAPQRKLIIDLISRTIVRGLLQQDFVKLCCRRNRRDRLRRSVLISKGTKYLRSPTAFYAVVQQRSPLQRHRMPSYEVPRHGMPCYEVQRQLRNKLMLRRNRVDEQESMYSVLQHQLPMYEVQGHGMP